MSSTNPQVDAYFAGLKKWRAELTAVRRIVLGCGLTEELKWRQPCYTHQGSNVLILGVFKDGCTLSFFKGALLQDPEGVLSKPGENSRAARVIRFTDVDEVERLEPVLRAYIDEAIEVEKAGLKVDFSKGREVDMPAELQARLDDDPVLDAAFAGLTPGRRRAYLLHFSAPKQSSTRSARIEKCVPRILAGKGMNDCVCGHTKKPPGCDGSHKQVG